MIGGAGRIDELVFRAIVACPGLTVRGIAHEIGVIDTRVYPAVKRLRAMGLVKPYADERPAGWEPVEEADP